MEDDFEKNAGEQQVTDDEPSALKRLLSKKYVPYILFGFWSLFMISVTVYFFMHRQQKDFLQKMTEHAKNDSLAVLDSTMSDSIINDSTASNIVAGDSAAEIAYADTQFAKAAEILSVGDQIKILALENGRRKREIDHLWEDSIVHNKQVTEFAGWVKDKFSAQQHALDSLEQISEKIEGENANLHSAISKEQMEQLESSLDEAIASNAKIYGSMKPKQAAKILSEYDIVFSANILLQIRERQAAKILQEMNPDQAAEVGKAMVAFKMNRSR